MSSIATVAVVKTKKHTVMNSVRAHDLNLLIMLTPFAAATHNRKKAGNNFWSYTDLIFYAYKHIIFAVQLLFHRRFVRGRNQLVQLVKA
jgi:hypothetical protein